MSATEESTPSLQVLVADVIAVWRSSDELTDQTSLRMSEIAERFARRMSFLGVESLWDVDEDGCQGFIDAPRANGDLPSNATRHFRRVTLRALFRTARGLGYPVGDPTLDIRLPPRSDRSSRPLTTDEVILCRTATFARKGSSLQRAAAWALAEAGATTAEIPLICREHLDDPTAPATIRLPGTRRVDPRTSILTDWGQTILIQHLAAAPESGPIVYRGTGGEVASHAAACKQISLVLNSAGLTDRDVKPDSVRLWRAKVEYERSNDLIAAARLLGSRSLDRTAEGLHINWRQL